MVGGYVNQMEKEMSYAMARSSSEGYSTASIQVSQLKRLQKLSAILKKVDRRTTLSDALSQALDAWEEVYGSMEKDENED